jgi:4-amino-4-deoxy-L-arabinose transferase-like glycosyltransferase
MPTFLHDYFSKLTEKQLVFCWLLFCFFALTYSLSEVPPYHTDENFYVESSRNMVESGDYLTPIYNHKKRFNKPILYYWLVSASYKIFGVSLASARLVSAFFGSLAIGFLYLIARRLFERRVAFYSIMILPATFLHFQISRWATTDIVMSFFVLLALYFFVRSYQGNFEKISDIYLFYVSMALGFITKGPPAIIIPGVTAIIFLVATRRRRSLSLMRVGQGSLIFLLVSLPWFVTMYALHGDEFTNHIIGAEIKGRIGNKAPFSFYYLGVLFRYHLPWSLFFVVAVLHQFGIYSYSFPTVSGWSGYFRRLFSNMKSQIRILFSGENESVLFCYIWILVCLVLFVLLRIEHSRYMLPAASAVTILIAKFFVDLEKLKNGFDWPGYKVPLILTSVVLVLGGLFSCVTLYALNLFYPIPPLYFLLPVVFFVVGVFILRLNKRSNYGKQVFAISTALIFTLSFLSGDVLSHTNRYPMKLFSQIILAEKFTGPIVVYNLGNNRARLGVLTGQKILKRYTPPHLAPFLSTDEEVWIIMREKAFREKFPDSSWEILAEDTAWIEGRIDWKKIKELLGEAESSGFSKLTEKIYLLSKK